jgi:hypothetical protein
MRGVGAGKLGESWVNRASTCLFEVGEHIFDPHLYRTQIVRMFLSEQVAPGRCELLAPLDAPLPAQAC